MDLDPSPLCLQAFVQDDIKHKLQATLAAKAQAEFEDAKEAEIQRRQDGQAVGKQKAEREREQMALLAQERRKEKEEARARRQKVLQQVEEDKAKRQQQGGSAAASTSAASASIAGPSSELR